MNTIKIRYNNECKDGKNYWRAIINSIEYHVSDIVINVPCKTTKDYLIEKQEYKWHISVEAYSYEIDENGILTINN